MNNPCSWAWQIMAKANGLPNVIAQASGSTLPLTEVLDHSRCPAMLTAPELERPEILFVNKAFSAATGYANSELVGMLPEYLLGALTDQDQIQKARSDLREGGQFHGPILAYGKDGETILFDAYTSPVRDEGGRIECWLSILPVLEKGAAASLWKNRQGFAEDGTGALVVRQIARAQAVQRQLSRLKLDRPADLARAFEIPAAVAIIDSSLQVLFASHQAGAVFGDQDGITLNGNKIEIADKSARRQMAWCISRALRRAGSTSIAPGDATAVPRPSGGMPYIAILSNLPWPHLRTGTAKKDRALLYIFDPAQSGSNAEMLQSLFSLTHQEAAVVNKIVQGESLLSAATQLGISRNTARNHLQRAFEKTGVNRQSQLVRLVLSKRFRLGSADAEKA